MTPAPTGPTHSNRAVILGVAIALLFFAFGAGGYLAGAFKSATTEPPKVVTTERPTPSVVVAIQSLARLQSVAFHMERVVDITKKEQALWGLVQTEDNILLVAVGDVQAGVDLGKLGPTDITLEPRTRSARIVLPRAEVFSARLDNERTYVHSRKTDVLRRPDLQLESEARKRAEQAIHDSALEAGILELAETSAANTVRALVLSLGYEQVVVDRPRE
jgi:hypothetical protein